MRQPRNIEIYLNDNTIKDAISSLLYTLNIVRDDEEILSLSLGEVNMDGARPILFNIITNREPEVIVHS